MMFKFYSFLLLILIELATPLKIRASLNKPAMFDVDTSIISNPISIQFLKNSLSQTLPRLVLNQETEKVLLKKLNTDPLVKTFFKTLKADADNILEQPLLKKEMLGRRLNNTPQIMTRFTTLGMVYHITKDKELLKRLNLEILEVCAFPDWNPSHYLGVAAIALSMSLALDWSGNDLPGSTLEIAKKALIEKSILPSFGNSNKNNWWVSAANNWNQVCHSGMIAAAITVVDVNPELAAETISRALNNLGLALAEYGPDGVYPEGVTYWGYGTQHTIMTIEMLENAFGTDFGISNYLGFMESAAFIPLMTAPSGEFYNFYDCGKNIFDNKRGFRNADIAIFNRPKIAFNLLWYATKTNNSFYFDKSYFIDKSENRRTQYFDAVALVWLAQFDSLKNERPPLIWSGKGQNHLAVFKGEYDNPNSFYLGAKGGKASNNHGNMDAGSFIFELNGVRWSIDQGTQDYHELEKTGFDLWSTCQECDRWKLITKNNFGHSTLTVNDKLHDIDGEAKIIDFQSGDNPIVTFDITNVFLEGVESAERSFIKHTNNSLIIEDNITLSDKAKSITWQMITTADVHIVEGGAILNKEGKQLMLSILEPKGLNVSIISLNPPPLEGDKRIDNLKRIEIGVPPWLFNDRRGEIKVMLRAK